MAAIPIPITGLAGRKSLGIGVLCGLAVALIWSGWSVATRFAVTTSLGPYDVTFLRFGVSALLLWPILVRKGLGIEQIGIVRLLVMVLVPACLSCCWAPSACSSHRPPTSPRS